MKKVITLTATLTVAALLFEAMSFYFTDYSVKDMFHVNSFMAIVIAAAFVILDLVCLSIVATYKNQQFLLLLAVWLPVQIFNLMLIWNGATLVLFNSGFPGRDMPVVVAIAIFCVRVFIITLASIVGYLTQPQQIEE